MQKLQITILAALLIFLASCGSSHYSPLDNYIKATIQADSLNAAAKAEAAKYIDSLNRVK